MSRKKEIKKIYFHQKLSFFLILCLQLCCSCAPINETKGLDSPDPEIRGKALYTKNCSDCHGQFSSSDIPKKTSDEITWALSNIGPMTFLRSNLSNDNISDIEISLLDNSN